MENPRLTFVSPTVITGDRSLVSLVAHELAHSWSGNLVTSSSHRDLWLNEGVTTYVESRIIEVLYGRPQADMENVTSRHELATEFTDANRALQPLVLPPGALKHPEDHLTGTIYTKGAWFLHFLEQRFGRRAFDAFLRGYFEHYAFQSISSAEFVEYTRRHLLLAHPGNVTEDEFHAWLYEPGIPASAPRPASPRLEAVDAARSDFLATGTLPATSLSTAWVTQEWLHFLAGLPPALNAAQLRALDSAYRFTGTPNAELANVWYPLTIRSDYTPARPALDEYLNRVGRRRMVLPTYRALAATPEGRVVGREILSRARAGLHPITLRAAEAALAEPSTPAQR
jgi:leukotriene-A4 hydrolase